VTASYRWSYFSTPDNAMALSTARAGNVIGGGDWAEDRIVPDIVRGLLTGKSIPVRNPASVRPWQHVLEPLNGYLMLTAKMFQENDTFSGPWNFGPDHRNCTVQDLVERFIKSWGEGSWVYSGKASDRQKEARTLRLDSTKAKRGLGWRPQLLLDQAVDLTVDWYKADTSESYDMGEFSEQQIREYSSMSTTESRE